MALDGRLVDGCATRAGFCTNLMRDLIPHELGGTVDLSFEAEGLCCKIEVPVERL